MVMKPLVANLTDKEFKVMLHYLHSSTKSLQNIRFLQKALSHTLEIRQCLMTFQVKINLTIYRLQCRLNQLILQTLPQMPADEALLPQEKSIVKRTCTERMIIGSHRVSLS